MYVNEFKKKTIILFSLIASFSVIYILLIILHCIWTLGPAQQFIEYNTIYIWERTINENHSIHALDTNDYSCTWTYWQAFKHKVEMTAQELSFMIAINPGAAASHSIR